MRLLTVTSGISIHAPHEGERRVGHFLWQTYAISIHAPHEGERRAYGLWATPHGTAFQSTLPTRGSDCLTLTGQAGTTYFNPRSPRGGATFFFERKKDGVVDFNPRSPRGGATQWRDMGKGCRYYFNPRSPRGGATRQKLPRCRRGLFQSTLPTRGSDLPT